jgi:hypothetical protein
MNKQKITHWFVIGIFTLLYLFVSIISSLHVIEFFQMSNYLGMAICLAIAFEMGAAASLASIIVLDKMNKAMVWLLFITLTLFQMMGNVYYAYVHLEYFTGWIELFGLHDYDIIMQKRVLAILSGAVLPVVALGFIKALVDYVKPTDGEKVKKDVLGDFFEKKEKSEIPETVEETTEVEEPKKNAEVEQVEQAVEEPKAEENVIMIEPVLKQVAEVHQEQPESVETPKTVDTIKKVTTVPKQNKEKHKRIIPQWPIKTTKINPKTPK